MDSRNDDLSDLSEGLVAGLEEDKLDGTKDGVGGTRVGVAETRSAEAEAARVWPAWPGGKKSDGVEEEEGIAVAGWVGISCVGVGEVGSRGVEVEGPVGSDSLVGGVCSI
ncbi:hypothetical protein U1Q18_043988 [Sarracenia purpurea var. burkii]